MREFITQLHGWQELISALELKFEVLRIKQTAPSCLLVRDVVAMAGHWRSPGNVIH